MKCSRCGSFEVLWHNLTSLQPFTVCDRCGARNSQTVEMEFEDTDTCIDCGEPDDLMEDFEDGARCHACAEAKDARDKP